LFGREIDHGGNLPADQVFTMVIYRHLCRCLAFADLGAEIDPQFVGRDARLAIRLGAQDRAGANIDLEKILE
jgi:hypothetical protein